MKARIALGIGFFEMRHFLRDKVSLFSTLVLPLVLVIAIGGAFSSQPDSLPIGVVTLDESAAAEAFVADLEAAVPVTLRYADSDDLARDIRLGFLSGGAVVDSGFGAALASESEQAVVTVWVDSTSTNSAVIAAAITSVATEFALAPTAVRVTTAALPAAEPRIVTGIANEVLSTLPPVTTETVTVGVLPAADAGFTRAVTTQFVLFTFLNGMLAATTIVESRRLGVSRRMLATPTGIGPHITGVGLGRWWLGILQAAILFGVGAAVFKAGFGDPVVVVVLALLWAALAAAVGMALGAVAKTPEQVVAVSIPLGIGLAMLGGSMWPLSVVPPFMQTIGRFTPHAWANEAFLKVTTESAGLADVLPEIAVLAGITVALAGAAIVLLRKSLSR